MPVHHDLNAASLLPLLTVDELRDIEQRHAQAPLMERAGAAAAEIASAMMAGRDGSVVVLTGPGNNGGDALVCARHLRELGFDVVVVGRTSQYAQPDAANALAKLASTDVRIVDNVPRSAPALIVDGLFGIGLSRAIAQPWSAWIEWANASGAPILALDVPSGLDAVTGVAREPAITATATTTFIAFKPGLLTGDGPDRCGDVSVHALGLDGKLSARGVRLEWRGLQPTLPAILARRVRKTHKGTFGRACIVGGAEGLVGAALLAGRAAIRLGAGRVVVGLAARDAPLVDWLSPELMLREADGLGTDHDAWVVGPGLGSGERARALLVRFIDVAGPLVVDADGLNAIAADRTLIDAVSRRSSPTLATPHPAEAARLLQCTTADVQADRVRSALALSSMLNAHVVLKGAGSIVARPDGSFDINATGNPALSTAGSGDVLAGILGALLAQRIDPPVAMRIAVCLHGAAADMLVARGVGPLGVTASEVIDAARELVNETTREPARR
ncbi:MAG TPA: NAD(P)H-hydrate dehydratase [Casimicrobiaceae bacterium]|nr:NAD(P)H-hydrate dehydratase [Casimicrobiaceae bacterium]